MPRSASAECSRAVGRRAARRTAPARARSAPDGAKTRGDNEQGGAHRHLHSPAGAAYKCPRRRHARVDRGEGGQLTAAGSAGTPRTSLRRRGCGSSGQLAAAPGAVNASILPCRRLGRVLLLRCPSLLYACDCLYACDALLEHVHEGPRKLRRNALGRGRSLSSSLFPGRAQACARSLFPLFPEPSVPGQIRS